MARLPDRFDLLVRQARTQIDPARQADMLLGALAALREWHFLNVGDRENPRPAQGEIEGGAHLLLFSDRERIGEIAPARENEPPPVISIPTAQAMPWVLASRAAGLLVNPGADAFVIPLEQLGKFYEEWQQRGGGLASGFWIPGLTSEEEDFWQEHGL
jgi:hypothetical protein